MTDLPDDELMRLFTKLVRYQDYIHGKVAEIEIDETSAQTMLEISRAKHLAQSWTGASTDRVAIAKAEATLDPEVQKADDVYATCRAQRKMWAVIFESLARDAAVVSREITRRVGRHDTETRADRWAP